MLHSFVAAPYHAAACPCPQMPQERIAEIGEDALGKVRHQLQAPMVHMLRDEVCYWLLTLSGREADVLHMRYGPKGGEKKTVKEVARAFKVSGVMRWWLGGAG